MRTPRLYTPDQSLRRGAVLRLNAEQQHYLRRVLRLDAGAQVQAFDGAGQRAETLWQNDTLLVQSSQSTPAGRCRLILGLGISQRERMEYAVQKSTELGVAQIVPLTTRYAEWRLTGSRGERRIAHWQKIAASACEQCGQDYVPRICAQTDLQTFAGSVRADLKLLLDTEAAQPLGEVAQAPQSVAVAIGPRGGWHAEEMAFLRNEGFVGVRLGPRVLRAETAPVAVLALLQWLWGDYRERF